MYRICTTEKSAQRQQLLARTMLEALKTHCIQEISISDICRTSGVSRKQFYELFHNKTDVILALIDQTILDYGHFNPELPEGAGWPYRCLAYWREQWDLLDALKKNQMSGVLLERCVHHATQVDPAPMDAFKVGNTQYSREMMMFYTSGVLCLILHWHDTGYERSIEQMCELLELLLLKSPVDSLT